MNKKAIISVVELGLVAVLFVVIVTYVSIVPQVNDKDNTFQLESMANSIYYDGTFRDIIMNEDISGSSPTLSWTPMYYYLNASFRNFEIIILNDSDSLKIVGCETTYYKKFTERVLTINTSNSSFEFRRFRLGVCY